MASNYQEQENIDCKNSNDYSCYYTSGYYEGRSLFRQKAQELGLPLYNNQIKNNRTNDLTIDITVINEPLTQEQQQQPLLLHISGTHGAEGYTGSAIQIAYLDKILKKQIEIPKNVTIVLVHALNPFGFLYNRRWNENGVDLNRNFIPEDTYPGDLKKLQEVGSLSAYKDFEHVFNLKHTWVKGWDDVKFYWDALYNIVTVGFFQLKQALIIGQYYCKDCLYFGGEKVQPSIEYILDFLKQKYNNADKAILIDVHTGLGPEGIDTLMVSKRSSYATRKIFQNNSISQDIIGKDYFISDNQDEHLPYNLKADEIQQEFQGEEIVETDAGKGYDGIQGCSFNLLQAAGFKKGITVVHEFGTVAGIFALKALVEDQSYWINNGSEEQLAIGGEKVKSVFYRENSFFKNNTVRRGLILIDQALIGLQDYQLSSTIPKQY